MVMSIRKLKNNYHLAVAALALALSLSACSSVPQAPAETSSASGSADQSAPDDALKQELEDAKSKAAEQQKLAGGFGGPQYAAADYEQGRSLISEADGLNLAGADDYRAAVEKYKAAAEAFQKAGDTALPQYFAAMAQEVQTAREKAVEAGAGQDDGWKEGADPLALADNDAAQGESLVNAKDYYGAAGAYNDALSRYDILETQARAYALKAEIEQYNLQRYDPDLFQLGESSLENSLAVYNDKDFAAAKTAAGDALTKFQGVADPGWEKLAAEQAAAAKAQQDKALEIKADVAMQDDYNTAAEAYTQGENAVEAKEFKPAYDDFTQALTMFTSVYNQVFQLRQAADALLKQADKKVSESGDRLKNAQQQVTKNTGGK